MYDHLYARDDANRSKRYAFCGYRCEEWRAREAAHPMCLPATPRILDPANLFCNMQCTTVCITAAGSRVAKRTPGTCPGGCPSGFARQRPSVDHRGVVVGDTGSVESPRQTVGQPPESGEPVSLTGRPRGSCKTGVGDGVARATPGGVDTCIRVRQGLPVGRLSGWVTGHSFATWWASVTGPGNRTSGIIRWGCAKCY